MEATDSTDAVTPTPSRLLEEASYNRTATNTEMPKTASQWLPEVEIEDGIKAPTNDFSSGAQVLAEIHGNNSDDYDLLADLVRGQLSGDQDAQKRAFDRWMADIPPDQLEERLKGLQDKLAIQHSGDGILEGYNSLDYEMKDGKLVDASFTFNNIIGAAVGWGPFGFTYSTDLYDQKATA